MTSRLGERWFALSPCSSYQTCPRNRGKSTGYTGSDGTLRQAGCRLLKQACVRAAIDGRVAADPKVHGRERIQQFWSEVMDSGSAEMKDRLQASQLLARSQGMFVVR